MNIAYVRVSTVNQNLDRQEENLKEYNIDKWFIEKASAKDRNRSELNAMLDFVRAGDKIFIHSLDRIARNTIDLLEIIERLKSKEVELVSVKDNIDFNSNTGKFMATILGAVAELERNILLERQKEGIAIAKEKGVYKGRQPIKINSNQFEELYKDWKKGYISQKDIMDKLEISRSTLYRRIKDYEKENKISNI